MELKTTPRLGARSLVSVIVFSLALLGACNNSGRPAVSLEEAKQITADLEGADYVPPPRKVTDVTVLLDERKNADIETLNERRAKADAEPPATENPSELAKFYSKRGRAASQTGRIRQAIADYEKAKELTRAAGSGSDQLWSYFVQIGRQYGYLGDYQAWLSNLKQAYSVLPERRMGIRISTTLVLAIPLSRLGRFDEAHARLADAASLLKQTKTWKRGREWIPFYRAFFEEAKGNLAQSEGRYDEAEPLLRSALAIINEDIDRGGSAGTIGRSGKNLGRIRATLKFAIHRYLAVNLLQPGLSPKI